MEMKGKVESETKENKDMNGEPTSGWRVADDETFVSDSWTLVTIQILYSYGLRPTKFHLLSILKEEVDDRRPINLRLEDI